MATMSMRMTSVRSGLRAALRGHHSLNAQAPMNRAVRTTSCSAVRGVSTIRTQEEMEALGARVSRGRRAGDIIFLNGDLGCGKTCFARGFIRAMTRDERLQVTSPTYLLVNTYEDEVAPPTQGEPCVIYHVDLYRLETVSDVDAKALGLMDAFTNGVSLVEWPQRLQSGGVPAERLEVVIEYDNADGSIRHVRFLRHGERWRHFNIEEK